MLRYGLIALPLIEIALFVVVGRAIGVLPVLALVIAATAGGLALLRHEGMEAAQHLRNAGSQAVLLSGAADRVLRFLAGVLLIVPGFLSDLVALALLVPGVRRWIVARVATGVAVRAPGAVVVEAEYVDVTPPGPGETGPGQTGPRLPPRADGAKEH